MDAIQSEHVVQVDAVGGSVHSPVVGDAIPAYRSLRWKVPLAVTALIAALVLAFMWVWHRTVEETLVQAGTERAHRAAVQVASMLDAQRGLAQLRTIAVDADLRRYLRTPDKSAREAARQRLASLAFTGPRRVELWAAGGSREILVEGSTDRGAEPKELPAGDRPTREGVSELQAADHNVFYDIVAEIADEDSCPPVSHPLGYLRVRSSFSVSPPGIIGRLVGDDAVVKVGNASGGVWTDFSHVVSPPGVHGREDETSVYRAADGVVRLGASVPIAGTPWLVWVAFPLDEIIGPATIALRQMTVAALIMLFVSALMTRTLAGRVTRPLTELSDAAAAIASGQYSRRVAAGRSDEIGRLGRAFNAMAGEVEAANDRLETRVALRTAELAAARLEADRANQAKSAFLSAMSHDLRTPLNAILGFAQLLELDDPCSERSEPARQILNGGRYLLELINEVLDISRIESGQLSLSSEPVGVGDVVQRAVDLIEPLAVRRGITLTVEALPEHAVVHADRQRLGQVLINLLSNGIKYNRPNGRVTIRAERMPGARLRILITDTGAGIPASKLALLFQPFERLGAEQTPVEGTGLGLVLARALVEAMGGRLDVESVVDEGSTFWLELAEATHVSEPESAERSFESQTIAPATAGTILYIEDNQSNVRLMERILRQRPGVQLIDASQGSAGLAMLRQRKADLVLLDMHLPDMSGEDVLRQLWENPEHRHIPIVVVTADATPGLARRLQAAGATACITKPLNVREVLQQFDTLLNDEVPADDQA